MLYKWTAKPPRASKQTVKVIKTAHLSLFVVVDNLSLMSSFLIMYINFRWWCVVTIFKSAVPLSLLSTAACGRQYHFQKFLENI